MKCHICKNHSVKIFDQAILKKHRVNYYKCTRCNFIQTDEPFWLEEAYSKAIALTDVGLVSRNLRLSKVIHTIICRFFNPNARFIDYGAGYGLLVRLLRDSGFNFYHYDKNCENLLSHHFSANLDTDTKYELLTAIEVFEHVTEPIEEIKKMLSCSDNILFTTMLTPGRHSPPNDWWYYTPQTGQHVSFYSMDSLQEIAKQFNLNLSSNSKNIHLLSAKPINNSQFKFFSNYITAHAVSFLTRRRSLRDADYQYALKSDRTNIE